MNRLSGTLEPDQQMLAEAGGEVGSLPEDLLHGTPAAGSYGTGLEGKAGHSSASGGWFADSTPGVDELGRQVYCRGCSAGVSQPRIDYGLNRCPSCRPAAPVGDRTSSAVITVRVLP